MLSALNSSKLHAIIDKQTSPDHKDCKDHKVVGSIPRSLVGVVVLELQGVHVPCSSQNRVDMFAGVIS